MRRNIAADTVKIVKYHRKGIEMVDIADALGISAATVRNTLIDLGFHIPKPKVSEDVKKDVVNRVKDGQSVTNVAKETGQNESTIYGWLRKEGILNPSSTLAASVKEGKVETPEMKKIANQVLIKFIKSEIGRKTVEEKGMITTADEVERIVMSVLKQVQTA